MVAPKEQAVGCAECHTRDENGRLAKLAGFYLPGRDHNKTLDTLAYLAIIGSLLGVIGHALIRIIIAIRNKKYQTKIIDFNE